MFNPFARLSPRAWRRIFIVLTAASLTLGAWLTLRNRALMNPGSPLGLWSLAAERDGYGARTIIDNWELLRPTPPPVNDASGIVQQAGPSPVDEAISLAFHRFPFILLYTLTLSLACLWAGIQGNAPLAGLGLAAASWGAALLHAVENTALLRMLLSRDPRDAEALIASTCFAARLVLVAVILLWLYRMLRRGPRAST
jgi:hypothetical protein